MWLLTIHHVQLMKPLDRAVFWIEFVMCHKRVKHLRPLGHNLTWYQYHSLDVIGFLLTCVAVIVVLIVKCFLLVYRFFVKKEKKMKNEQCSLIMQYMNEISASLYVMSHLLNTHHFTEAHLCNLIACKKTYNSVATDM